jgi:glycosyltransferase involved in cell wall biosynthesis
VVAFDATGPSDIVDHKETGWLAEAYEAEELAVGTEWVLETADREAVGDVARARAVSSYLQSTVAKTYAELYDDIT